MLNHITIQGRLTDTPELRMTQNQIPVTQFTLACQHDRDKETDFINVVFWRKTAEFVSKYFSKGQLVLVSGRLQSRTWEDKNGSKRKEWEVVADKVWFCESKRDSEKKPELVEVEGEEELPF